MNPAEKAAYAAIDRARGHKKNPPRFHEVVSCGPPNSAEVLTKMLDRTTQDLFPKFKFLDYLADLVHGRV